MDSYDEVYRARESDERSDSDVEAKMVELIKTKEELKLAKDGAMQSWLDSRPLIDKLERLQSHLASVRNQASVSNIVIVELESQLETTIASIKSKKAEELKATKMIEETNQALDQTREEMERVKQSADEDRRARLKLKQVLRQKRQTLRALQLTLRALRMESEAYGASTEKALGNINLAKTRKNSPEVTQEEADGDSPVKALQQINNVETVQLTQEDYRALQRKAKEETSLAKWRISVSMEQKLAAEESRDSAAARLRELQSGSRSRRRRINEEIIDGGANAQEDAKDQDSSIGVEEAQAAQVNRMGTPFPQTRARQIPNSDRGNPRQLRRSKSNSGRVVKKKKPYILRQIHSLLRNIKRLFR